MSRTIIPLHVPQAGEFLFDFAVGLTARYWDYGKTRTPPEAKEKDKLHPGYGGCLVRTLSKKMFSIG